MPVVIEYDHLPRCAAVAIQQEAVLSGDIAKDMQKFARRHVAVRTGALFRGIEYHYGDSAEVTASSRAGGAPREYAYYNEYGTRYMSPHPFMMPAFVEGVARLPIHARKYGRRIEEAA